MVLVSLATYMVKAMKNNNIIESALMEFFAEFTEASIEAARVQSGERINPDLPGNISGYTLIRPGGRACYPAVWTQDFAITLATGFVTAEEIKNHLRLIAKAQNGEKERRLKSGAIIPPFAIPDHVLFDGQAVFYPGTYSSGEDQGGEPWGIVPPTNNHYDFILIAWHLWQATGKVDFLKEELDAISMIERLRLAFQVPRIDSANGLVYTEAENRAVGFIFCDSIYMTGHLLFASLLRWRAAQHLAELEVALGNKRKAEHCRAAVADIPESISSVFDQSFRFGGWLIAATEVGRQPDVWGTIYALHLGLLAGTRADCARAEIVKALEEDTICYQGAVRHVPTNHDASEDSAWERTPIAHNYYQNGAYWHTPTGWLIDVLADYSPGWARRIFEAMVVHFQKEDFRQGDGFHAPWECFGKNEKSRDNPLFIGSVAVPYGVLKNYK